MKRYEERLEADLKDLRDRVAALGDAVGAALANATRSFTTMDLPLASETIVGDHVLNREAREIDRRCHAFVARHVPSAGHLRFVSSVMRMNVALERIGDYAVTISRESAQLKEPPPRQITRNIEAMSESGRLMLAQAMEAFRRGGVDLARGTKGLAASKEREFHTIFHDLLSEGRKARRDIEDLFGYLVTLYRLNRVEDQVKNICEETIFIVTGETKQPKVYQILFVDEAGARWSPMAAALARKAFPESGKYYCCGWNAADDVDARITEFLDGKSFGPPDCPPRRFTGTYAQLVEFDVVIGLRPGLRDHVEDLPFHTVLLEWDVVEDPDALDEESLEQVLKRTSSRLRDLMEVLSGEGAS